MAYPISVSFSTCFVKIFPWRRFSKAQIRTEPESLLPISAKGSGSSCQGWIPWDWGDSGAGSDPLCALQVHQSAQALRWMIQALRGNGFSPGEDVPAVGKHSLLLPSSADIAQGPRLGLSSPSHPSVKQ